MLLYFHFISFYLANNECSLKFLLVMFLRLFVQELLEPLASQDRQEILDHRDFRDLLEVLVAWDRLVHRVRWDFQDLQVLRVSNILVNCSNVIS